MTDASPQSGSPRTAWLTGGILLVAGALFRAAVPLLSGTTGAVLAGAALVADILFAAALVVFAFGFAGGAGSVVRRRPLGVAALLVLGVWPLFQTGFWALVAQPTQEMSMILGYGGLVVQLAAALIAVVEIVRQGVVPGFGRWAPAIALALVVFSQVLLQIVGYGVARLGGVGILIAMSSLVSFAAFLAIAGLGVLAIVLALRPEARVAHERTVQVYPPAS